MQMHTDSSDKSKYNKNNFRQTYNDVENKEIFTENNKTDMPHNNSMKMMNNLELNECSDIVSKIYKKKERNKKILNELDNNFKTINSTNKMSYITNNIDKSFNFNDSFKKEILHHKRIIQVISNGKKVKFSYNFNSIKEKKENIDSNNNNKPKKKKKKTVPDIQRQKRNKSKNVNSLRKEKTKKDNNIESKTMFIEDNKDKEKNKDKNDKNDINKKIKKFNFLFTNYEKEKEKEKEKNKNMILNSKEEEKKKVKDLNSRDNHIHKKINSFNILSRTLSKNEYNSKIYLKKRIDSKSPNKQNQILDKNNNEEKTNHIILEQTKQASNNEDKKIEKNTTLNMNSLINNKTNNESDKNMLFSKTIDFSPSNNLRALKNKSLSFYKSIEHKRNILGLNINIIKEKNDQEPNYDETLKITEHILLPNHQNKNLYKIFKIRNKSKNEDDKNDKISLKKVIKVTKAPNLGDKNINEKKKNIKNNKTSFNLISKKVLSANRSVESYENICNDNIKNSSYKKLILERSKKKDKYNNNLIYRKKNMKKFDFYLTDKNFFSDRRNGRNKDIL